MDFGVPGLLANWRRRHQAEWSRAAAVSRNLISPGGIPSAEAFGIPSLSSDTHHDLILQAIIVTSGDKTNEGRLIQGVTIPWFEILRELDRDPQFLLRLTWRKFEEFIAGAYTKAGYSEVILTPPSGDGGRDIIATNSFGQIRIIDQVKLYSPGREVTPDDVRALAGVLTRDRNVSKGIVTTTSIFAPSVYKEWEAWMPYRLELKNGIELRNWLMTFKKES
jgi:restriction system protein